MKQSKYDKNHDGLCDAPACKSLLTITGDREVEKGFIPALSQNLKSIGIVIKDRVLKDAYTPIQTPRLNIAFSTRPGWGKDYADALTFYAPMFDGRTIAHREHQLPAAGHHARDRQEAWRQRERHRRAQHQRRYRQVRRAVWQAAHLVLCGARQEAHLEHRSVGALPLVVRAERLEHERHQVRVRPVRRDDRLRARSGQVLNSKNWLSTRGGQLTGTSASASAAAATVPT